MRRHPKGVQSMMERYRNNQPGEMQDAKRKNEMLRQRFPHLVLYWDGLAEMARRLGEEGYGLPVPTQRRLFVVAATRDYPDQIQAIARVSGVQTNDIPRFRREVYGPDLVMFDAIRQEKEAMEEEEIRTALRARSERRGTRKGMKPGTPSRVKKLNQIRRFVNAGWGIAETSKRLDIPSTTVEAYYSDLLDLELVARLPSRSQRTKELDQAVIRERVKNPTISRGELPAILSARLKINLTDDQVRDSLSRAYRISAIPRQKKPAEERFEELKKIAEKQQQKHAGRRPEEPFVLDRQEAGRHLGVSPSRVGQLLKANGQIFS